MSKPNILYIHSHDTGRYVQPYGHAVDTPNIQKLAEQGVLFRQAFCASPTCSPSRACLLTGQWPHNAGMLGLAHRGFGLYDYKRHLIHTLRDSGYHSALAGVQHVAHDAKIIGYDQILGDHTTAHEVAARFIEGRPAQPFFLSVGFFETHRVFPPADPEDDPKYILPPTPMPDTPEVRQDMAQFKTSARILDRKIGTVLDALDRSGLAENTLVICTTDHGIPFPRMKCTLHDDGIGVMLIMRGPGGFTGGQVCNGLVSHIDIFPTLCDLLQIQPPDWLEGVSVMPMIRGQTQNVRDEVFGEITYHAAYEPQRCLRTARWKYIRRFDDRSQPVWANCDDSPSKTVWMAHHFQSLPQESLYDLLIDPTEHDNLATRPDAARILDEMRGRLHRWMQQTEDPLLIGPVSAPPGARIVDPDACSPKG